MYVSAESSLLGWLASTGKWLQKFRKIVMPLSSESRILKSFLEDGSIKGIRNIRNYLPTDAGECLRSLAINQLDAQFIYFIISLLQPSTYFEQRRAHHQEVKL